MTDNIFDGLRGYIEYPCGCKAKILVYNDAHGTTSIQCPICRKYAVFNYDSMTAVLTEAATTRFTMRWVIDDPFVIVEPL